MKISEVKNRLIGNRIGILLRSVLTIGMFSTLVACKTLAIKDLEPPLKSAPCPITKPTIKPIDCGSHVCFDNDDASKLAAYIMQLEYCVSEE